MNKLITLSLAAVVFATAGFAGEVDHAKITLVDGSMINSTVALGTSGELAISGTGIVRNHGTISGSENGNAIITGSTAIIYNYSGTAVSNNDLVVVNDGSNDHYYWVALAYDSENSVSYIKGDESNNYFGAGSISNVANIGPTVLSFGTSADFSDTLDDKDEGDTVYMGSPISDGLAGMEIVISGIISAKLINSDIEGYSAADIKLSGPSTSLSNSLSDLSDAYKILTVDSAASVNFVPGMTTIVNSGKSLTCTSATPDALNKALTLRGTAQATFSGPVVVNASITVVDQS